MISPIKRTLQRYIDFERIAGGDVKLIVTATNIVSGEIEEFSNDDPANPITMDYLIASGSLPPSYPAREIGEHSYWDGGLFDNTPLSALLGHIDAAEAATTRAIVINLFPKEGEVPKNMLEVFDRMTELEFANKTRKDVALAQKINKLVAIIEALPRGRAAVKDQANELAKYKVFEHIIAITNNGKEPVSSSADFSKESIERRIDAGYRDAAKALGSRQESAKALKAAVAKKT
jgi:NTE family protein